MREKGLKNLSNLNKDMREVGMSIQAIKEELKDYEEEKKDLVTLTADVRKIEAFIDKMKGETDEHGEEDGDPIDPRER